MSSPKPLSISNLSVGFDKPVFTDVDLEISENEFVTLMGENGAGKTTLIDTLMGFRKAFTGRIRYWDQDFSDSARADINQKVGWVVSHHEMYPTGLSIKEFLISIQGLYPAWDLSLQDNLASYFNLDLTKKLNHLSLGERSKVKLIKALSFRPKLLVLDELTANLSQDSKNAILGTLIDLFVTTKMAVLYISHSKDEALKLSDRVVSLTRSGLTKSEVKDA